MVDTQALTVFLFGTALVSVLAILVAVTLAVVARAYQRRTVQVEAPSAQAPRHIRREERVLQHAAH